MTFRVGKGVAPRVHLIITRFEKGARPGRKESELLSCGIPKIRKLLRTDASLEEIASEIGVQRQSLRNFIKRRNICDMDARRKFNALKKSLATDERVHGPIE